MLLECISFLGILPQAIFSDAEVKIVRARTRSDYEYFHFRVKGVKIVDLTLYFWIMVSS